MDAARSTAPRKDVPTLKEWLSEGPFALAMSSGFFGFFAHAGVLSVLEDAGLLPSRVAGSSAGALVTGAWAAGVDAPVMQRELFSLTRADFWDPFPGFGVLRGRLFRERLLRLLPRDDFGSTRVPVGLSAFHVGTRKTEVIEEGSLATAIHASCAVPLMFHPVWIGGRAFLDGGILDRPGLRSLEGEPRVLYHHLLSRSPWRRKNGAHTRIPQREGLVALSIAGLPRSGPFKLEVGKEAFAAARKATEEALDRPLDDDGRASVMVH